MIEWQPKTLGEITDWFSGGTPSKQNESYWNGDIPWISAKTLKGTRVSDSELKITKAGLENGSRLAQEGDILLLVRGSGLFNSIPISIVEKPVSFNQDIKAIRIKKEYDYISPWFLLYWLHGNKRILNGIMEETGIGAGKFDLNLLKDLTIELPAKDELQEITRTFKSIDDKIVLLRQQNQDLEELAQTLFKRWFVEFEFPNENDVPYKSSGGKMVESELGEIPVGWNIGALSEMFDFLEGPGIRNWQYTESGVPFINIRLINQNNIDVSKANFVSLEEGNGKYNHFKLQPKDMVVSTSGSLGKTAIVRKYHLPLLLNTSVIRFRPIGDSNYPFMYQYLKSKSFERELLTLASGSVQLNFGPTHLKQIEMIIPDKNILALYGNSLNGIYDQIIENLEQINTLTQLRDNLLPKLMSGELRIN